MFSLIRRFIFTILAAQWIYAEAVLLAPSSQPVLDTITQFLKPPTHDKWIETYQILQSQRNDYSAAAENLNVSSISGEISTTVEKLARHGGFGSVR